MRINYCSASPHENGCESVYGEERVSPTVQTEANRNHRHQMDPSSVALPAPMESAPVAAPAEALPVRENVGLVCMSYLSAHPEVTTRLAKTILLAYARYPSSDNTNLFVYGKIGERALMESLIDTGRFIMDVSNESRVDMQVDDVKFSIKTTINIGAIILENYRGDKRPIEDLPPTFAILFDRKAKKMYLLYIDNETVTTADYAKQKYNHSDSNLTLNAAFVRHLVKTLGADRKIVVDLPDLEPAQCVTKNMMDFVWNDIQSCL